MLLADSIVQKLQQNQAYLKEMFGVESLVLFGSYARNTQ